MTKRDVVAAVKYYKRALVLDHWTIDIDFDEDCGKGAEAEIFTSKDYPSATMLIAPGWQEWEATYLGTTVLHELLHCVVKPMSRANDFMFEALGPEGKLIGGKAWHSAEESVVEHLQRAITALHPWPETRNEPTVEFELTLE